jgi:hypothetical protein
MSLFRFSRFIASFVDDNGDYVGTKIFSRSFGFLGHSRQTFTYKGRAYNISPSRSSRLELIFKTSIFFDNYVYVYNVNHPDPIIFKNGNFDVLMNPLDYQQRLESKLVKDLNAVGFGSYDWVTILKWLGFGFVVFLVMYYFISKGQVPPVPVSGNVSVSSQIVNNVTKPVKYFRGS